MPRRSYIVFKTEANKDIGSGHFVRCLIMADEFAKQHVNVSFVLAESEAHYRQVLDRKGYPYEIVSKTEALDVSYYRGLREKQNAAAFLVVFDTDDAAYLDEAFQLSLREKGVAFMHITVNDQAIYHSDLLLCQNIIAFRQDYRTRSDTMKLLGPDYFIYRPEFRKERKKNKKAFDPQRTSILICFGGADRHNLSLQAGTLINRMGIPGLLINVVVGGSYAYLEEMKAWAGSCANVRLHHNTDKMLELLEGADVAVTSGGLTLWEAAVLRKPVLAIATSEREQEPLEYLEELNYITYLGTARHWKEETLLSSLANLDGIFVKLQEKADRFGERINPNGVLLVVERIKEYLA